MPVRRRDGIVGDVDGLVVIPKELLSAVADAIEEKGRLEARARRPRRGLGIRDVWDRYGVF